MSALLLVVAVLVVVAGALVPVLVALAVVPLLAVNGRVDAREVLDLRARVGESPA